MRNLRSDQQVHSLKLSPPVALIDCAKETVTGFVRQTVLERRLQCRDGVWRQWLSRRHPPDTRRNKPYTEDHIPVGSSRDSTGSSDGKAGPIKIHQEEGKQFFPKGQADTKYRTGQH